MEKSFLFMLLAEWNMECLVVSGSLSAPRLAGRRPRRLDEFNLFELEIFDFARRLLGEIVFLI